MELTERFWSKVQKTDTCWLWTAALNGDGYGRFGGGDRKVYQAHRWIYEQEVGPIPPGLTIDHLCRVHACVRPSHLEAVSRTENVLRGEGPTAINARKTHCANGHAFTEENTLNNHGNRGCRACYRAAGARYYLSASRGR